MNQTPAADCGGSRRSTGSCCTNGCLHSSRSASRNHMLTSAESFYFAERFSFLKGCGWTRCWLSIVILCWLFIPPSLSLGSPPHSPPLLLLSSPLFSPPSPALASNGLNRLASCQSRGLLWLCHKSARKNRNHLFRPGPERGWGCKYTSLALTLSPARAHWTTEPSGGSCAATRY